MITHLDYQGDLTDTANLAEALAGAGLGIEACRAKARLLARATAALRPGHAEPVHAFFVPGRIEVLGKHTDYAGGSSLVAAVERGIGLVAAPRADNLIFVTDASSGESIEFRLAPDVSPESGHWRNYPMTVARRVARNFSGPLRGADVAIASDLPPAAGMSSSSAMIVAFFLALDAINRLSEQEAFRQNIAQPTDLAGYLGTIENGQSFGTLAGDAGVGTFGGSEDHTAILCSRAGFVRQYAYCPVRFQREIPLPEGCTFAVGTSGVIAEKTGEAQTRYNAASGVARAITEIWRRHAGREDPHLAAALASDPTAQERLTRAIRSDSDHAFSTESLIARLTHFVIENRTILPAASAALAAGNLDAFGRLVDRSQQAAEQFLGNQVPETIHLAASARSVGASAASAFGAGFGGSAWALVETRETEKFLADWARSYRDRFPSHESTFFQTGTGPAAFRVA